MTYLCYIKVRFMQVKNYFSTKLLMLVLSIGCGLVFCVACSDDNTVDIVDEFVEKQPIQIHYPNCQVEYIGDDIGEATSDGWLIKFYTDMQTNDMGMLEGEGCLMQLLLNVKYEPEQTPELDNLVGTYLSQSNSGDFSANTFVYGYMDYIDLPGGRIERADATFYGEIADGVTEENMEIDLIDDGVVNIKANGDGTYTVEGTLVGKKCIKRIFTWSGEIEPTSRVEPAIPNSTLTSDLTLNNLTQGVVEDRGDYFYLKDESYRDYLIFLAEESINLSTGRPQGSGDVLRLELLVPWTSDIDDGIPSMVVRNEDTSIDKDNIAPFHSVPGLPNSFSYPYWAGTWYVDFADGVWGNSYARIDRGSVTIDRAEDGSYHIVCTFEDSSSPSRKVSCDVVIAEDKMKIMKYV